ncbi:MAG: lamin tail domain-containing protein [Anaerolineaceae bacterium]
MKKLWPFLLLNVLVSATTVLIVLLIWNATHPSVQSPQSLGTPSVFQSVQTSTPFPLPSLKTTLFEIQNVIGAGDLENEHIHFVYLGNDPLNLDHWQIKDEQNHKYTFPAFIIYKKGAFDLYTKAGQDSTIELYMAKTSPLWQSGETITFLDSAGNIRLTYAIP